MKKTGSSFRPSKIAVTEPMNFENLGKRGVSKNDSEIKMEKALIELNEMKNDMQINEPKKA
jgi:hypothetical protein